MTAHEYHSADGVSNTMLGELERSPLHLHSYLLDGKEATKAMELGTDFHDLLLLHKERENIAIKPDGMSFATREGKAWRAEQEAAGKEIVEAKHQRAVLGMRDSIMANPMLRHAIETGDRELSLFADFGGGMNGMSVAVKRKGRLDLVPRGQADRLAIVDFKTTTDASPRGFGKTIGERYLRQGAYYLDLAEANGLPHRDFLFVAVEKQPPYAVGIYYLTPEQIEAGRASYVRLLQLYMQCVETNRWPGYPSYPVPAEVPAWALRKEAA